MQNNCAPTVSFFKKVMWKPTIDASGAVKGGSRAHPLDPPHSNVTGYSQRKQKALGALGGVSRNDTQLHYGTGDMPWIDIHHTGLPSHPISKPRQGEAVSFMRTQADEEWLQMQRAPDHSRYALRNQGLLGDGFDAFFSAAKIKQKND